ncbi:nuclease-related domain-containing protein [Alteribacillus sp. YIM 98480]|uniref:nuclease-related domain-containing protein n=1 Tax=Alteribacillus sp. YIM 98480 TaxID=2606599 RepID=UPI00131DCC79|nr:nuclease-related domain-containing protein [Alteribacillus sp. YIM 98480]
MIEKPRKIPLKLQTLEAILRRLPSNHPKREEIETEHTKTAAGYQGEKSLDYYLHFLPDNEYLILNDLRLPHKNHFFQIDTLLLSTRFHLIIEVKNFSGTLYFDPTFQQMIRISNETEEAFPDPILQVKLQRHQLFHWLNQNNCKPIPIETCVVITSPYTHLKTSAESGNQYQHVIHSANLLFTFESFEKKHPKISNI